MTSSITVYQTRESILPAIKPTPSPRYVRPPVPVLKPYVPEKRADEGKDA
jgi:hypothetical protein